MKEIKMRVNRNADGFCSNCRMSYKNTKEMYDIMIFGEIHQLCYECVDNLFQKTLKAQINDQSKLKTKEDLVRAKRSDAVKEMSKSKK